jgi:hypothetical protein
MKSGANNWKANYDKVSAAAVETRKVIKSYRTIVDANGKNAGLIKVLEGIGESNTGHMLWDIALDQGDVYYRYNRL